MLPDRLRLGEVHLKVTDLARSIDFYERVIGLDARTESSSSARLSAGGEDILVLHELPDARRVARYSGLYHVALLYPTREELARVAQRIQVAQVPIDGASDHGTHEAIYLPDPDGNGLELAWDRAREHWPDISNVTAIRPQPLDIGGLFNIVSGREVVERAEAGLTVGHLHLHVGSIEDSLAFYRDAIGFDLVAELPGSAAFVSAGGYHHHLAFNTWHGAGAPPAPDDAVGLDHWTIELPSSQDVAEVAARLAQAGIETGRSGDALIVRDPSGNAVQLSATAGAT